MTTMHVNWHVVAFIEPDNWGGVCLRPIRSVGLFLLFTPSSWA
jgi:hypothetical protein